MVQCHTLRALALAAVMAIATPGVTADRSVPSVDYTYVVGTVLADEPIRTAVNKVLRTCRDAYSVSQLAQVPSRYVRPVHTVTLVPSPPWPELGIDRSYMAWTTPHRPGKLFVSLLYMTVIDDPHLWEHIVVHEVAHMYHYAAQEILLPAERQAVAFQAERACFGHTIADHPIFG